MAAKDGKDKYLEALSQAEAGKTVRDHLKHSEFDELLLGVLRNQTGFSSLVLKVLFLSAPFWAWMLIVSLIMSLFVVKFPMVAEWICSLLK